MAIMAHHEESDTSQSSNATPESLRPKPKPQPVRRTRPTTAQPGSLYDIFRTNRAELFVLPPFWTDMHSQVLDVEFVKHSRRPTTPPTGSGSGSSGGDHTSTEYGYKEPSELAKRLIDDLTKLLSAKFPRPYSRACCIKSAMATLYPSTLSQPKSMRAMPVYFGDRVYSDSLALPVVWENHLVSTSFDSAPTQTASGNVSQASTQTERGTRTAMTSGPVLAFVDRALLEATRESRFRSAVKPRCYARHDATMYRLRQLRMKQMLPGDPECDAFLASAFLTMAQAHFYERREGPWKRRPWLGVRDNLFRARGRDVPHKPFHDVPLRILEHDEATSEFLVYSTTVTPAFLERFASPTRAPSRAAVAAALTGNAGLRITVMRVPIWPVLGLQKRLAEALGPDITDEDLDEGSLFYSSGRHGEEEDDVDNETNDDSDSETVLQAASQDVTEERKLSPEQPLWPKKGSFTFGERPKSNLHKWKRKRSEFVEVGAEEAEEDADNTGPLDKVLSEEEDEDEPSPPPLRSPAKRQRRDSGSPSLLEVF